MTLQLPITAQDVLTSDGAHPDRAKLATAAVVAAAADLAVRTTKLLTLYLPLGAPRPSINSGYRTPAANAACHGAPNSSHLYGMAIDLLDPEQELSTWCVNNQDILAQCGLWMENPSKTPTWTHVQSRPVPGLNGRVFMP